MFAAICGPMARSAPAVLAPDPRAGRGTQLGAVVGWLLAVSVMIVVCAVVAPELERGEGGRLVRVRDALTGAAVRRGRAAP